MYNSNACIFCKKCLTFCPVDAIEEKERKIQINYNKCRGCGACTVLCEQGCYYVTNDATKDFQKRIAIAAKASLKKFERKAAFMNFLIDITPRCDCCSFAGKPLISDIGVLSSLDAVAVDKASYDLVCSASGKDIFYEIHNVDGTVQFREAEKIGLGKTQYKILEIRT